MPQHATKISYIDANLGKRLRMFRESKGKTMKEVAEYIDKTMQMVAHYEKARHACPISVTAKICDFLEVPLEKMVQGITKRTKEVK